jgi:hypothetical protein
LFASQQIRMGVDDLNFADGMIVEPGTDVLGFVRRDRVEPGFEQDAFPQPRQGGNLGRIAKPDSTAPQLFIIEGSVALNRRDAVDLYLLVGQPIVERPAAFDVRGLVLIAPGLRVHITLPGQTAPVKAARFELSKNRRDIATGRLVYGRSYLERTDAVPIDPIELKLAAATYQTVGTKGVFGALRDAGPDYWRRRVIEGATFRSATATALGLGRTVDAPAARQSSANARA